jgi:hypothetical protein
VRSGHVTAWRSSQEILKISTSSFVARARNRSRCVSIRMTSKLSDRLPRSTVSDTPRWRDQFSKGGWRAREAGAAEDTVGKLAGLLNDCHPQPRATPAQPAGCLALPRLTGTVRMLAPVANVGYTTLGRIRSRTVVGAFTSHELPRTQRVVALALKHRLPAVYWLRGYPQAGGLMSYGADLIQVHRDRRST